LLLVVFLAAYFAGGVLNKMPTRDPLREIHEKVVRNAEHEYSMVVRSGGAIDVCVHAGLVAAAYLQAHDDLNYQRWKTTERSDCELAGVPR
jgi:hypothetical protein